MLDAKLEEIETDVGPLLVNADDTVITPSIRARGQELGARVRPLLQPGMTVVDLGANLGFLALVMAEEVGPSGRVVAIEPDPRYLPLLRLNAERTRGATIEVIESAAWSENGGLDALRQEGVDLMLIGTFCPRLLRESGADPVSVLDRYRAQGLRVSGVGERLPSDPGELVLAVDARDVPFTTLRLEPVDPKPPRLERLLPPGRRLGRTWARRFPTVEPRTLAYDATHRALITSLLVDQGWRERFAGTRPTPPVGAGFDERVVEYPWLFSRGLSGRVLDAGSVLNHRHLIEYLLPTVDDLTIVTLAPEPAAFTELGVSYLFDDLRTLPLRDDCYDEIVCLSTLEHVGMDNTVYGAAGARAENPRAAAAQALRELMRVVRPGGHIHLSVPYGRREDHGWLRQLDREDLDDLLAAAGAVHHEDTFFRLTSRGWRRSAASRVSGARYHSAESRAEDGAVAARAVACVTIHA